MSSLQLPENFSQDFHSRNALFVKTLASGVGDATIFERLLSWRVAIAGSEGVLLKPNGQYMAAMTVNLLARLCSNLTLFIPDTVRCLVDIPLLRRGQFGEGLYHLAKAINPLASVSLNPSTLSKYDASIAVANGTGHIPVTATINSDGWISFVDTNGNGLDWAGENANPIGAYNSACLGVAEAFKRFLYQLQRKDSFMTLAAGTSVFSALDYVFGKGPFLNPPLPPIRLGSLHFVSMGALNSAVLYVLCSLPDVGGDLTLVEPQTCDVSNLNRYVMLTAGSALNGTPKVALAEEVAARYFGSVSASPLNYRAYRATDTKEIDLAVVGVDNNQGRWDVQTDRPRVLICGGTERAQVTISRHDDSGNNACAGCVYSAGEPAPSQNQPIPTISFVSAFAGFLMAAEVLKARIAELNKYRLELLLDVESLHPSSIQVRRPGKSPDCKCNCSGRRVVPDEGEKTAAV